MSDFSSAFPNSQKIYLDVDGSPGVRVPMREIALDHGRSSIRVYDTSGPQGHDVKAGLPKLRENFRNYFARNGVAALVFPATMMPAPVIGEDPVTIGDRKVPFLEAFGRNIAPGSTAGLPGLVLPAGLTQNGLPVSLEFDGPSGTDRALLALGLSLEGVLGHLPPPKV